MQIKRRMFRRIETVEQITVRMPDANDEVRLAGIGEIKGDKYFLQILRADGAEPEDLFACGLQGRIEIEQTSGGDFTLVCKRELEPEQKMIGD